ncbi:MAG: hypothetical protein F3745_02930 [Nitrospinae bacterium]|nr:hypothetical protein [Nitrospinota bacterium]
MAKKRKVQKAVDPSRTKTLRLKFEADLVRRFKKLRKDITQSIIKNDALAIKTNAPLPFRAFQFSTDPNKHEAFMEWLNQQIDLGILEVTRREGRTVVTRNPWTNLYVRSAYQRGISRARSEMRSQGVVVDEFGRGIDGSLSVAFNQPFHLNRVALAFTRTFTELQGVTDSMAQAISRELAQGLADGSNPRVIARNLVKAVDSIGINRAKLIAQTEVIRAHHAANIQEYRAAQIEGVVVIVEFNTAFDDRVCARCARLAGKRYTLDEIEPIIPVHPRCRCFARPLVGDDEKSIRRQKRIQTPEAVRKRSKAIK